MSSVSCATAPCGARLGIKDKMHAHCLRCGSQKCANALELLRRYLPDGYRDAEQNVRGAEGVRLQDLGRLTSVEFQRTLEAVQQLSQIQASIAQIGLRQGSVAQSVGVDPSNNQVGEAGKGAGTELSRSTRSGVQSHSNNSISAAAAVVEPDSETQAGSGIDARTPMSNTVGDSDARLRASDMHLLESLDPGGYMENIGGGFQPDTDIELTPSSLASSDSLPGSGDSGTGDWLRHAPAPDGNTRATPTIVDPPALEVAAQGLTRVVYIPASAVSSYAKAGDAHEEALTQMLHYVQEAESEDVGLAQTLCKSVKRALGSKHPDRAINEALQAFEQQQEATARGLEAKHPAAAQAVRKDAARCLREFHSARTASTEYNRVRAAKKVIQKLDHVAASFEAAAVSEELAAEWFDCDNGEGYLQFVELDIDLCPDTGGFAVDPAMAIVTTLCDKDPQSFWTFVLTLAQGGSASATPQTSFASVASDWQARCCSTASTFNWETWRTAVRAQQHSAVQSDGHTPPAKSELLQSHLRVHIPICLWSDATLSYSVKNVHTLCACVLGAASTTDHLRTIIGVMPYRTSSKRDALRSLWNRVVIQLMLHTSRGPIRVRVPQGSVPYKLGLRTLEFFVTLRLIVADGPELADILGYKANVCPKCLSASTDSVPYKDAMRAVSYWQGRAAHGPSSSGSDDGNEDGSEDREREQASGHGVPDKYGRPAVQASKLGPTGQAFVLPTQASYLHHALCATIATSVEEDVVRLGRGRSWVDPIHRGIKRPQFTTHMTMQAARVMHRASSKKAPSLLAAAGLSDSLDGVPSLLQEHVQIAVVHDSVAVQDDILAGSSSSNGRTAGVVTTLLCDGKRLLHAIAGRSDIDFSSLVAFDDLHTLTGSLCAQVASLAGLAVLEVIIASDIQRLQRAASLTGRDIEVYVEKLGRLLSSAAAPIPSQERSNPELLLREQSRASGVRFMPQCPPRVASTSGVGQYFSPMLMGSARGSIQRGERFQQSLSDTCVTAEENVAVVHALARLVDPWGPLRLAHGELRAVQLMLSSALQLLSITRADAMPVDTVISRSSAGITLRATMAQVRKELYARHNKSDVEDAFGMHSKLHDIEHLLESCLLNGLPKGQTTAAMEGYNRTIKEWARQQRGSDLKLAGRRLRNDVRRRTSRALSAKYGIDDTATAAAREAALRVGALTPDLLVQAGAEHDHVVGTLDANQRSPHEAYLAPSSATFLEQIAGSADRSSQATWLNTRQKRGVQQQVAPDVLRAFSFAQERYDLNGGFEVSHSETQPRCEPHHGSRRWSGPRCAAEVLSWREHKWILADAPLPRVCYRQTHGASRQPLLPNHAADIIASMSVYYQVLPPEPPRPDSSAVLGLSASGGAGQVDVAARAGSDSSGQGGTGAGSPAPRSPHRLTATEREVQRLRQCASRSAMFNRVRQRCLNHPIGGAKPSHVLHGICVLREAFMQRHGTAAAAENQQFHIDRGFADIHRFANMDGGRVKHRLATSMCHSTGMHGNAFDFNDGINDSEATGGCMVAYHPEVNQAKPTYEVAWDESDNPWCVGELVCFVSPLGTEATMAVIRRFAPLERVYPPKSQRKRVASKKAKEMGGRTQERHAHQHAMQLTDDTPSKGRPSLAAGGQISSVRDLPAAKAGRSRGRKRRRYEYESEEDCDDAPEVATEMEAWGSSWGKHRRMTSDEQRAWRGGFAIGSADASIGGRRVSENSISSDHLQEAAKSREAVGRGFEMPIASYNPPISVPPNLRTSSQGNWEDEPVVPEDVSHDGRPRKRRRTGGDEIKLATNAVASLWRSATAARMESEKSVAERRTLVSVLNEQRGMVVGKVVGEQNSSASLPEPVRPFDTHRSASDAVSIALDASLQVAAGRSPLDLMDQRFRCMYQSRGDEANPADASMRRRRAQGLAWDSMLYRASAAESSSQAGLLPKHGRASSLEAPSSQPSSRSSSSSVFETAPSTEAGGEKPGPALFVRTPFSLELEKTWWAQVGFPVPYAPFLARPRLDVVPLDSIIRPLAARRATNGIDRDEGSAGGWAPLGMPDIGAEFIRLVATSPL